MPRRQPMTHGDLAMAVRAPRAFRNPGWVFELEYEGLRALARGGLVPWLVSRKGEDLTPAFPELRKALAALPACLLDCELVMLDDAGRPDVAALRKRCALKGGERAARAAAARPALLYAFDLVELEGEDLREHRLVERKSLLESLLAGAERVIYVRHTEEDGVGFFEEVDEARMAGIVAKRADSPYRAGKNVDWMKISSAAARGRPRS